MTVDMVLKAAALWLIILVLAVANGILRESVLVPGLGRVAGFVLSGLILSALVVLVAYLGVPWLRAHGRALLGVGLGWLVATLVFEFAFGLLRGKPMGEILAAYTFREGNLWPLVLLVVILAPWVAGKLRGMA